MFQVRSKFILGVNCVLHTRVSNSDIEFRNSEIEYQYRFRNSKVVDSDISKDPKFAKFGQDLGNFGNLSKIDFHGIKVFEK